MSPGAPSPRSPLVLALIFSSPVLADDLFQDSEPLPQNHYDQRHVMYFSAELEL
ncbi:hypothetical protein PMI26_02838 [Pseudomonas sp. GM33]|uniref:hypothetical protein n=1 Tax=Pseudomonas sp. GM33 TaxID=1144329 RepID=UPI0002700A81|nr:hypothetical protein [Pseudomonas sp. GM33]EJM42848.1 hypothetical protein PMI26_02838 [Pseudomonas sp. GM33]MDP9655070.1 hypothetical protein [Pseudomonas putida]